MVLQQHRPQSIDSYHPGFQAKSVQDDYGNMWHVTTRTVQLEVIGWRASIMTMAMFAWWNARNLAWIEVTSCYTSWTQWCIGCKALTWYLTASATVPVVFALAFVIMPLISSTDICNGKIRHEGVNSCCVTTCSRYRTERACITSGPFCTAIANGYFWASKENAAFKNILAYDRFQPTLISLIADLDLA